jgi:hypothetical protein
MTTASTNTVIDNTSNAGFQAWVNEIYTNLVTNCGLTQTGDTGQMAVPCVTARPATSTVGGYYILRFNDSLQGTSPIFFKLEFGQGVANGLLLYITLGTGSNGAGTINGTTMTRVAACSTSSVPSSNVTNYVSRYCYDTVTGTCWMGFKYGGNSAVAYGTCAGFIIYRSVDNTGAPTATSVHLVTNSGTTSGSASSAGVVQILNYVNSVAETIQANNNFTGLVPFNSGATGAGSAASGTVTGGNGQVFPGFQWARTATSFGLGLTNAHAACAANDISLGSTTTVTILGSTSITYMSAGNPFGGNGTFGYLFQLGASNYSMLCVWQ